MEGDEKPRRNYFRQRGFYADVFWRLCQLLQFVKPICVKKCGRSGSRRRAKTHLPVCASSAIFAAETRAREELRHRSGAARKICWLQYGACVAIDLNESTFHSVVEKTRRQNFVAWIRIWKKFLVGISRNKITVLCYKILWSYEVETFNTQAGSLNTNSN